MASSLPHSCYKQHQYHPPLFIDAKYSCPHRANVALQISSTTSSQQNWSPLNSSHLTKNTTVEYFHQLKCYPSHPSGTVTDYERTNLLETTEQHTFIYIEYLEDSPLQIIVICVLNDPYSKSIIHYTRYFFQIQTNICRQ
jgi:hypothetical protein